MAPSQKEVKWFKKVITLSVLEELLSSGSKLLPWDWACCWEEVIGLLLQLGPTIPAPTPGGPFAAAAPLWPCVAILNNLAYPLEFRTDEKEICSRGRLWTATPPAMTTTTLLALLQCVDRRLVDLIILQLGSGCIKQGGIHCCREARYTRQPGRRLRCLLFLKEPKRLAQVDKAQSWDIK